MNKWMKVLLGAALCMWNVSALAADGAQPSGPPDQSFIQTMVMLAIAFVFFWLILWRPEQKRRRELEKQRSALKKGDRVTAMGIVGTVSRVQEQTVILRMVDGSKIEVLKGAINEVISGEGEAEPSDKDDTKDKE